MSINRRNVFWTIFIFISIVAIAYASNQFFGTPTDGYVTPEEAERITDEKYWPGAGEVVRELCEIDQCYIDEHGDIQLESERDK